MSIDVPVQGKLDNIAKLIFRESMSDGYPVDVKRNLDADLAALFTVFGRLALEVVRERNPNQPGGSRDRILTDIMSLIEQYALALHNSHLDAPSLTRTDS